MSKKNQFSIPRSRKQPSPKGACAIIADSRQKKGVIATPPTLKIVSLLFKVEKSQKAADKQTHHPRRVPQAVFVKRK